MSQPTGSSDESMWMKPIESTYDLINVFIAFEKPKENHKVGTKFETFVVDKNQHPAPYFGNAGIEAVLTNMYKNSLSPNKVSFREIRENGHLIALAAPDFSVTLEPGGQVELSGAPKANIHETYKEVQGFTNALRAAIQPFNLHLLQVGFHPSATRGDFEFVPKERYHIMRSYMEKKGSRGIDMMLRTATVQANLDYTNEAEMVGNFRLALAMAPIANVLFAASPLIEGKHGGKVSERSVVWEDTDPDRCGYPDIAFEPGFGYEKWIEFVLDVPMYFIRRGENYIDVSGASFRDFMKNGLAGHTAIIRDFMDHMTTVFTEARIKPQLEVRSADCSPGGICALPAFWRGLMYDSSAKSAAEAIMDNPSAAELRALHIDAARMGFKATYRGKTLKDLSKLAVEASYLGLSNLAKENGIISETHFLQPLINRVEKGLTFADEMVSQLNI